MLKEKLRVSVAGVRSHLLAEEWKAGRPHGCLRSAEAPGVVLIRNKAGSHYRDPASGFCSSSLMGVEDTQRRSGAAE